MVTQLSAIIVGYKMIRDALGGVVLLTTLYVILVVVMAWGY